MKKVKDPIIEIKAEVDLEPVRRKIAELRAELKKNPLKVAVEVDDSHVVDKLAEAHQLYEDNPLHSVATADTSQMHTALQAVRETYREMPSTVTANANTARAEAQLSVLSRRRRVSIIPDIEIPEDFQQAFRGIGYSIMGAIPADKVRASITGILANFESLLLTGAKVATMFGSIAASALTASANVLTVGADVTKVVGLLSVAPAVMSAFGVGVASMVMGWKDFAGALDEDPKKASKALAKLPKEAQAAALSLKGLGSELRKSSQAEFWKTMGTSIQDFMKPAFDRIKEGFQGSSRESAKFVTGALKSFQEFAEKGNLDVVFGNINKGLAAASGAAKPFFDALGTITLVGSKHLERYGTNLTNLATKFDAWATRVSQSGEMNTWITQAEANMKNLWSITTSAVDVFEGLSHAAAKAGGKSLADLNNGMKNFAGLINSEPFQTKLVTVLEGARAGTQALSEGFKDIKDVVSKGSVALSGFLHLAGQVGGKLSSNIAAMFDGTDLGAGIINAMAGARKAMEDMKPAFKDVGKIIGDIGDIAGVLFVNMAPGFVKLTSTLQQVIEALKDGIMDVIPVFNIFIQNILEVIAPIVVGVAKAVGGLLEGFAALPEVLRNVIMGFGLFLAVLKFLDRPLKNSVSPLQKMKDGITNLRDSLSQKWNTNPSLGAVRTAFSGLAGSASVAVGAVGNAFRQMAWMTQHTAAAIGEGFKKSFSQLGDQMKKLAAPAKEFASMMRAAMGEALFPQEVRDGFRQVGSKLMEVARIYTGYFTAAKDKIAAIGKSIASVFPASLLGPALKALPGEVAKTLAYAGQKVADGIANVAKTIAGPAVGYAMQKMKDVISTQALYASKHLESIGNGIGAAVNAIKAAPAAIASAVGSMAAKAGAAFNTIREGMAKAFNAGVLAAAVHPLTAPFVTMADAALTGAKTALGHVQNMAKNIGSAINTMTVPARAAFSSIAVAASIQAGVMADKFKNAAERIGGNISAAFRNAGADLSNVASNMTASLGRGFSGMGTFASNAASQVTDTMRRAGSAVAENFKPAVEAVKGHFSGIASAVRIAAAPIADLGRSAGTAAGAVGQLAGATAKWAGSGLLSALGGGWGLAIAGATAAITAIADAQAKSKARIDAFSDSLDKQTGKMTGLTKSLMLKSLFDGNTDAWDDFVRGFVQRSKSVTETLSDLKVDTKKYYDTMSDPGARDKYLKGMGEVINNLRTGKQTSKELAESLDMSADALTGLSIKDANGMANSLEHAKTKAEDMAKELQRAEEQTKLVAKVTGVNSAEAAILSKNYDILASSTSSVSDKFSALKENMRLVGSDQEKANLGQKGYQQSLRDTKSRIEDIVKANEGILLPSLFEVGKGFDFTKQAGADLHSALEIQVDGIQQLGAEAINKALAEGKKGEEVQRAALTAMQPAIDALRQNLKDLGFNPEQIQGIIDTFNLVPKDIKSSISVQGAEEAMRQVGALKIATDLFVKGDYEATLKVLPDQAKAAIEKATGIANGFKDGKYEAMLKVLDSTEGGRTAALAKLMTVVDGKYDAELTALNLTGPEVEAAKKAGDDFGKQTFTSKMDSDNAAFLDAKKKADEEGRLFSEVTYSSKMAADYSLFTQAKGAADAAGQGFQGTTYTSKMDSDTAAFERQKAIANAGGNVFAGTNFKSTIDANNSPFMAVHNNATITGTTFGQKTFKTNLDANDNASRKIDNVDSKKIGDKSFNIFAFIDDNVRNIARGLGIQLAHGGIINGAGVQTYANGGITLPKVNAYAGGGFENHVAQISRGQTPFRVWSEPETGGEAYIPLGKMKRPRSLKILDEVADMFGFTLVKKLSFASGGIMKSVQPNTSSPFSARAKSEAYVMSAPATPASGTATIVNYNVHPSQGLDEKQIAKASMDELYWRLSTSI